MGIKRIIAFLGILAILVPLCFAQEYVKIERDYYTIEYDDDIAGSNVEYFGWASFFGATETQAAWRIMRITYSGTDFIVQWADGDQDFDNSWQDRATLTYE